LKRVEDMEDGLEDSRDAALAWMNGLH
jgi:hypothetical protein